MPNKYHDYMRSRAWRTKRAKYWASKYPKNCYVCGKARHKGMHLHHITYERLGKERLSDLVPACEGCHKYIHDFQRKSGLPLRQATIKCKGALKQKKPRRN